MEDLLNEKGALPLFDTSYLLRSSAEAEKQQALVAHIYLDSFQSDDDTIARLSTLKVKLSSFIDNHAYIEDKIGGRYIWHRESPTLSINAQLPNLAFTSSKPVELPSLQLRLRTGGDCVEDEWFITYILLEATKRTDWAGSRLILSVEDEDGQFLLIEAADTLPKWVTPENVNNRVWIYDGHLHIIPPHYHSEEAASTEEDEAPISKVDALRLVIDSTITTRASDEVEKAAFYRLSEFPLSAADHHHTALAYLSKPAARVLSQDPQLISNAVEALSTRDVVSSRAVWKIKHFPCHQETTASTEGDDMQVESSDDQTILTPVRMTRHLYARLCYDRFFPPRSFGKDWQSAVEKYRLRMHNNATGAAIEDEEEIQREMREGRWRDVGAKVWCGLEMAYEESLSKRNVEKRRGEKVSDHKEGPTGEDYHKFIASLRKLGYFGEELEGSARWKKLEKDAMTQWIDAASLAKGSAEEEGNKQAQLSERIDSLLKNTPDAESVTVSPRAPTSLSASEDNEDWMNVDAEDMDTFFASRFGGKKETQQEEQALGQLQSFAAKMEEFMQNNSADDRGATFPDEWDDEDLMFEDGEDDNEEGAVRKEVEKRLKTLNVKERDELLAKIVPRMTEEEWGRHIPAASEAPGAQEKSQESLPESTSFVELLDKMAKDRAAATADTSGGLDNPSQTMVPALGVSKAEEELKRRLASQHMKDASSRFSKPHYEGVSESESDGELEEEESPEVRRQRAKEMDIDLDEEEEEPQKEPFSSNGADEEDQFLEFARQALGLTTEQYQMILARRREKGEYVPSGPIKKAATDSKRKVHFGTAPTSSTTEQISEAFQPTPGSELKDFDSVMTEMDRRLASAQTSKPAKQPSEEDEMEEELLSKLADDLPRDGDKRAHMVKHLLQSFKAQGNGTGPVGTLAGRFGVGNLPLDKDDAEMEED